jgi:Ca-activated chloride channel homolog
MKSQLLLSVAFWLLASAGFSPFAGAQYNPNRPPWAQKSGATAGDASSSANATPTLPPDAIQDRSTIRVDVNLVNVLVSVLDDHNRPAPDLPVGSFQLFEEGLPQKIAIFERETQQPLDLVLMIDASLSARMDMPEERSAAARFIQQVIRQDDRLAVYAFDEDVIQLSAFTDDIPRLQSAVQKVPSGGGTSIYDAVYLGARALERQGVDRRRVILLITDGGETTSHMDFDSARNEAVKAGTLLYTILLRPVKNEGGRNTAGEHALQTITDMTGGAMFFPNQPGDLGAIFEQINRELRTQYRLGYYPNPRGPANTYRTIEVKVVGSYTVRHRTTYFTGPK